MLGAGLRVLAAAAGCALLVACSGPAHVPGPRDTAPPSEIAQLTAPTVPGHLPGCSTAVAPPRALQSAGTSMLEQVGGYPFGIASTASGQWVFVPLLASVLVLRAGPGGLLPAGRVGLNPSEAQALGDALTPDGRYLLVADGRGADVIDVARAEAGRPGAVLGALATPVAGGAIEVAVSPDGQYAFISMEFSKEIAVFSLRDAVAGGFGRAGFIGDIPAGRSPVGLAVSPDGRWMYAVSEYARSGRLALGARPNGPGVLEVISLHRAETDPARSVVAAVRAGCQPVRVITSADGRTVWVTARESDALLAFSTARLRGQPARSLLAWTRTGEAPVGLALVRGGQEIVVADSNRFHARRARASLVVMRTAAVLAGRPAVAGYVRAGLFPREVKLMPGGRTLLVSNYDSHELESVMVADLP